MIIFFVSIVTFFNVYKSPIEGLKYYTLEISTPSIQYELKPEQDTLSSNNIINYKPNVHSFSGVSFGTDYGALTLMVQNNDEDKKEFGATKVVDLQIIGNKKNFLWEAFYQNYQGLYITDSDFSNDLPTADSWSYGVSIKQFFRKGFNLKKSFRNSTGVKESNWSWVRGLYFSKNKLFSSDGLIPAEFEVNFPQITGLNGIETTNLGLDFGIGGTYVYKGFFTTSMLTIGYQLQEQFYDGITDSKKTQTQNATSILFGFGYDFTKNHSAGFETRSASIDIPFKDVEYRQERSCLLYTSPSPRD